MQAVEPLPGAGVIDWAAYVPTEDTTAMAEAARKHLGTLFSTDDLRGLIDGAAPPDIWGRLVEFGYPLIGLPESLGGVGRLVDLVAALEEAGRALLPAPLLTTVAALQTLLVVEALEEPGDMPLAIGWWSGPRTLDVLDGRQAAAVVTVSPAGEDALVEVHDPGPRTPLPPIDASRPVIRFEPREEPSRAVLVSAEADRVWSAARTCLAADLTGVAARALSAAVTHALTREQFGRPIGSFQAVKHRLADAFVQVERARSLTLGASVEVAAAPLGDQALRLSRLAKAAAAEVALSTSALHIQLLGAMGLTFEADASLAVRRATQTAPVLGSPGSLYAQVALTATAEAAT